MEVQSAGDHRPPSYEELIAILALVVEECGGTVTIDPDRIAAGEGQVGQMAFTIGEGGSLTLTVMS